MIIFVYLFWLFLFICFVYFCLFILIFTPLESHYERVDLFGAPLRYALLYRLVARGEAQGNVLRVFWGFSKINESYSFLSRTHCIYPVVTLLLVGNSSTMKASLLLVSWDRDLPERQNATHSVFTAWVVNSRKSVLESSRFSSLSFQTRVMAWTD